MVIISKGDGAFRSSIQFKFIISYITIIAGLIILMNTYPLIVSRDLVFSSKEGSLQSQAQVLASSLSYLEVIRDDNVGQTVNTLDITGATRIIVTDGEGRIAYDTSRGGEGVGSYALLPEIYAALGGMDVFLSQYAGGTFVSYASSPIIFGGDIIGVVYISEYDQQQGELLLGIQSNLKNISIIIGLGSVCIAVLFSKTMTRRLKDMLRAIKIVSKGDYNYRLGTKGNDELAELGREFNELTDRLQKTEEMRRRFVSDASHELKTPLASIRLLSDSVVQNEGMDEKLVREFVQDIGQEAERLTRTTEKLLSLTRLDGEVADGAAAVDIKRVTENALHLLAPLALRSHVDIDADLAEGCVIRATEDDIYQVIFNLAENGIKYNVEHGTLYIRLYENGSDVYMVFEDTGIGIPKGDVPHIFDRFYRVDKARSQEQGGSGLGLSIVKDTVLRHEGWVEVAALAKGGTRFTVVFPAYRDGDGNETDH